MEFLARREGRRELRGDAASSDAERRGLSASRDEAADEPAGAGPEHRDAIWRGLEQGVVDVLGSDHAPHTLEEKARPYPESPSGMTGVQTLVPIMLDHVNAGRLSLQRFVDLTSAGPQRMFRILGKGRIAAGYDADFTVVDMKRARDDPRFLDRLALTLDALRRQDRDGLAGRDDRTRPPRDVGGRADGAVDGRGGAVLVRLAAPQGITANSSPTKPFAEARRSALCPARPRSVATPDRATEADGRDAAVCGEVGRHGKQQELHGKKVERSRKEKEPQGKQFVRMN